MNPPVGASGTGGASTAVIVTTPSPAVAASGTSLINHLTHLSLTNFQLRQLQHNLHVQSVLQEQSSTAKGPPKQTDLAIANVSVGQVPSLIWELCRQRQQEQESAQR